MKYVSRLLKAAWPIFALWMALAAVLILGATMILGPLHLKGYPIA